MLGSGERAAVKFAHRLSGVSREILRQKHRHMPGDGPSTKTWNLPHTHEGSAVHTQSEARSSACLSMFRVVGEPT